jgi:hypothetical protein
MFIDEMERRNVIHPFVRAGLHEQEDVSYFADALVTELFDRAIDERSATALRSDELARLNVTTVEDALRSLRSPGHDYATTRDLREQPISRRDGMSRDG